MTSEEQEVRTPERVVKVEILISWLLRAGVLLSILLVAIGTLVTFLGRGNYLTSSRALDPLISGHVSFPDTFSSIIDGVASGHGPAIVLLGLLVLVLTPIVRVAVSVLVFVIEQDRVFVAITLGVLGMLLMSFALGKAGG
jgi:uncharacterized membrane protein